MSTSEFPETLDEFYAYVDQLMEQHPEWRAGQTLFNALYLVRPDLSEQIRTTELDPFHVSSRIAAFNSWLAEHWADVPVDTRS
jgi:hypothetical protein